MAATSNTVTLITGGTGGIGTALCRRLARPGRVLFVHTGTRLVAAEQLCRDLEAKGAVAHPILKNFAEDPRAAPIIAEVERRCGRLDQLVHLAGYAVRGGIGALDEKSFEASLSANLRAFFHLTSAALPLLKESRAGSIVSAGSYVAQVFRLDQDFLFPGTAAAKAALLSITKSLAFQLAPHRVTVNCVVPGNIRKPPGAHTSLDDETRKRIVEFIPLGRFGEADEVAAAIQFLLSNDARYITGTCLHIDGGMTL